MFDEKYYSDKKLKLQQKNQNVTQRFLNETLLYAEEIRDITKETMDIEKWENEQKIKENKSIPQIPTVMEKPKVKK